MSKNEYPDTTNLDKRVENKKEINAIFQFMEFLSERGICLCEVNVKDSFIIDADIAQISDSQLKNLIDEKYGVDSEEAEKEANAVLNYLKKAQE